MQPAFDLHRFGMVPAKKVESFYRAYHGYLKDNGIDGVKVTVSLQCEAVVLFQRRAGVSSERAEAAFLYLAYISFPPLFSSPPLLN